MNLIRLKRFVRSNRYTRKAVDGVYAILTGQYREKRHIVSRNGEIYYVIRPPYAANGLGGLYLFVLGHMEYAYSKGYIPVVDFTPEMRFRGIKMYGNGIFYSRGEFL